MKKLVTIVVAMLFLAAGAAVAQQKDEGGMSSWLKSLQRKIDQITPKKSISKSTGVAGIRGAKDDEKAKLYWKGRKGEAPVTEEELMAFQAAVNHALKGDQAAAAKGLEEFTVKFPDSPLMPDVTKTLEMVKADIKAQEEKAAADKAATPAPEQKPADAAAPAAK